MVKVHVYIGRDRFPAFLADLQAMDGQTISPGGAAQMLGCSRQYVHKLMKEGKLEAWVYKDKPEQDWHYIEVSVLDVKEYARSHGKELAVL